LSRDLPRQPPNRLCANAFGCFILSVSKIGADRAVFDGLGRPVRAVFSMQLLSYQWVAMFRRSRPFSAVFLIFESGYFHTISSLHHPIGCHPLGPQAHFRVFGKRSTPPLPRLKTSRTLAISPSSSRRPMVLACHPVP